MTAERAVTATARDAGRNVVHTVTDWYGRPAITPPRRSARVYRYAIVRRVRTDDPMRATVAVVRWSDNPRATGGTFAVPVTYTPSTTTR